MARFKRRKPKVLWLPVVGNDLSSSEGDNFGNGPSGILTVPNDGTIAFDAVPVTFDYSDPPSVEQGVFDRSLQDIAQGNAYRLRRIVGKFFAGATPAISNPTVVGTVDLAAGFIVNRTDDSGNLVAASTLAPQDCSPLAQDASQDPWIWRRRWALTPLPQAYTSDSLSGVLAVLNGAPQYPQTTMEFGSVADGGHIDQKTARVIANQERLFFWVAARQGNNQSFPSVDLEWLLDIRILASLRFNQGNRRNASR